MALDLIAPLIPNAQENKGPELFLQAMGQGLAAFSRINEAKRNSEIELLRLAEHERVSQDAHELKRREMEMEAGYRDRQMSINEELLPYKKMEMEANADWKRATFGQRALQNAKRTATIQDFQERLVAYNLDDPNPKDPVAYYANANRLQDEFKYANVPEIKHGLKEVKRTTESHAVPIVINDLVTDEVTGDKVLKQITKDVPVGQIVEGLRDPKKQDATMKALERSGYMEEDPNKPGSHRLKSELRSLIETGKGTDFSRGKSRTLPADEQDESELSLPTESTPEASETNLFEPTETAAAIKQAQAAIAKGAPMAAVAQRLKEMGLDPGLLFDAA